MPETVLKGQDDQLPARGAALARFASRLTARPWTITADDGAELAAHGLAPAQVESATAVVAVFNYLTRVADASGIEFDYVSPLPAFTPERGRDPAPRPDRAHWPDLGPELRTLPAFPEISEAWAHWHGYVFDSGEPLTRRERRVLARAAAEECCDRRRADELDETPPSEREVLLDSFARKLSRTPWRMGPADLQALRDANYPETALLHAIAVVALQNAESRLAMGRAAARG